MANTKNSHCTVCYTTNLAEMMACGRADCPAKRRRAMLVQAAQRSPELSAHAEGVANSIMEAMKPWEVTK